MTINEYIKAILNSNVDLREDADTFQKIVYIAYYSGLEAGVRQTSDRYNKLLAEQKQRASKCRYHNMAMQVQGNIDYLYDSNYSSEITDCFGNDKTSLPVNVNEKPTR